MGQHDKIATLYCPVETHTDSLKSMLPLARTFMCLHSPSAPIQKEPAHALHRDPENNNQTVKGSVITQKVLHIDNLLHICMSAQCGPILHLQGKFGSMVRDERKYSIPPVTIFSSWDPEHSSLFSHIVLQRRGGNNAADERTVLRTKYIQVLYHHADGGRIVLWY